MALTTISTIIILALVSTVSSISTKSILADFFGKDKPLAPAAYGIDTTVQVTERNIDCLIKSGFRAAFFRLYVNGNGDSVGVQNSQLASRCKLKTKNKGNECSPYFTNSPSIFYYYFTFYYYI